MARKFVVFAEVAAAMLLALMSMPAVAGEPSIPDNSASDTAPNLLPGDASTPTAPAHDIEDARVTAQIRSALSSDKSLSAQSQNVTVATNPQAVVLRGSVRAEDKDRIETLAQQFAGTRQVLNQLQVLGM